MRSSTCDLRLATCAIALAALAAAGCSKGAANLCTGEERCAEGFSCDPSTGRCGCDSDASCGEAESCNALGFCQPRLRCESSADCAQGFICDHQSGVCIADVTCTSDLQCKQGEVCKDFSCVPGCRQSGDCPLSHVCRPCAAGTPAAQCQVGNQCVPGQCDSQRSCDYGEICAPPPADPTADTVCQEDTRGPYCESCSRAAGSPLYCQGPAGNFGGANYCLIDSTKPQGQSFFCGVDCSEGQSCPNGYECRDVRIVTFQNCDPQRGLSACADRASSVSCDPAKNRPGSSGGIVNDDCENALPPLTGAVCDPVARKCVPQCLGSGETSVQAFCSCIQDSDCPQDVCETSTRTCAISGKPCIPGQSPDGCLDGEHRILCAKVTDPRLGNVGYCRIGRNCAPAPGYTCDILR